MPKAEMLQNDHNADYPRFLLHTEPDPFLLRCIGYPPK